MAFKKIFGTASIVFVFSVALSGVAYAAEGDKMLIVTALPIPPATKSWCPACREMKPFIDRMKDEGLVVKELDGNDQKIIRARKITGLPTVIIVGANGVEKKRIVGFISEPALRGVYEKNIAKIPPKKPVVPKSVTPKPITLANPAIPERISVNPEGWENGFFTIKYECKPITKTTIGGSTVHGYRCTGPEFFYEIWSDSVGSDGELFKNLREYLPQGHILKQEATTMQMRIIPPDSKPPVTNKPFPGPTDLGPLPPLPDPKTELDGIIVKSVELITRAPGGLLYYVITYHECVGGVCSVDVKSYKTTPGPKSEEEAIAELMKFKKAPLVVPFVAPPTSNKPAATKPIKRAPRATITDVTDLPTMTPAEQKEIDALIDALKAQTTADLKAIKVLNAENDTKKAQLKEAPIAP